MKSLRGNVVLALAMLVWLVREYHAVQGQVSCDYRYTRQPPTELKCNPYDPINRLAIICSVEGPNTPGFSIAWFRRRNGAARDEELQASQLARVDIAVSQTIPGQFTRLSSRLALTSLDEVNDVGDYWCQVKLDNGTVFQEKSNKLTLRTADAYRSLSRCTGSSVVNEISCLRMFQINGLDVTNGGISVWTTTSSSDISPTGPQTTRSPIDETEGNGKNLPLLYAIIAAIVTASILVLLLLVVIASLKYNQQTAKAFLKKYESDYSPTELGEIVTDHQSETSSVNEDKEFDFKDNMAYNKVGRITLNVNVSYVATNPLPRPGQPQDYEMFVPSKTVRSQNQTA